MIVRATVPTKTILKSFGLLLLIYILWRLDWTQMRVLFIQADLPKIITWFSLYCLLFFFMVWLKAKRMLWLTTTSFMCPTSRLMGIISVSGFWGTITPGRIGEITRIWMLQSSGLSRTSSISVWIYDRLLDITSTLTLGTVALVFYLSHVPLRISLFIAYLVAYVLVVKAGWRLLQKTIEGGLSFSIPLLGKLLRVETNSFPEEMNFRESKKEEQRSLTIPMSLSIVLQAVSSLSLFSLFQGFGHNLNLDFFVIAGIYAISVLVSLIPISFGGLGTREATYIGLLSMYGVSKEFAIVISLLDGLVLPIILSFILSVLLAPHELFKRTIVKTQFIH